mgnify:CR=1 FL=1
MKHCDIYRLLTKKILQKRLLFLYKALQRNGCSIFIDEDGIVRVVVPRKTDGIMTIPIKSSPFYKHITDDREKAAVRIQDWWCKCLKTDLLIRSCSYFNIYKGSGLDGAAFGPILRLRSGYNSIEADIDPHMQMCQKVLSAPV